MPALSKREILLVVVVTASVLLAPLAVYLGYKKWQAAHFRELVAAEIGIGDVVSIGGESHFREGCGTAVFELAPAVRTRIQAHGARGIPDGSGKSRSAWEPTPYAITGDGMTLDDAWMAGFDCAGLKPGLADQLHNALNRPGAFVKKFHEAALIVVPEAGLVAFVYYG